MLKKFHVEFYGIILDSFETMPYKLCHFLTLTDYIQCVPILYSNDCEPLLQSRYACLYNLEPNFMPCLALHHFFASSNLLIDSHHFVTFLNKQEAIVASAVMIRCISWIPNRSNLIIAIWTGWQLVLIALRSILCHDFLDYCRPVYGFSIALFIQTITFHTSIHLLIAATITEDL